MEFGGWNAPRSHLAAVPRLKSRIATSGKCTLQPCKLADENMDLIMKNIPLSADENLIEAGHQAAAAMRVIRELQASIFTGGHTFTRDPINER